MQLARFWLWLIRMLATDGGKAWIRKALREFSLLHVSWCPIKHESDVITFLFLTFLCFFSDVEEAKTPARPIVPPVVPVVSPTNNFYGNDFVPPSDDPWSQPEPIIPPSYTNAQQQAAGGQHRYDYSNDDNYDFDSDFDDEESGGGRYERPGPGAPSAPSYLGSNLPSVPDDAQSMASSNVPLSRKTSKMFSKSSDSYIMGTASPTVPENEQVQIYLNEQGMYFWKPLESRFTVTVTSPKMESKFKGIKKFIAYQLQSSFATEPVSRRYKNFDWLHERLMEKFCLIPIPPLPDKQISGRYEEQFIEHRRAQLQQFVDWVCRHPILSKSDVWMHFLTCRDQKKWKAGKRSAEKDAVSQFACSIEVNYLFYCRS